MFVYCPGKRVSHYLGDLHASGLIAGLKCRSPDQKHPVKINIFLLLLLLHSSCNMQNHTKHTPRETVLPPDGHTATRTLKLY